jgi:ABC-type dipeptide/oligopeptide/nickel transport system permease component
MPPILRFLIRRLAAIPITMLIVTAVLYAVTMQAPAEVRAQLYLSRTEIARGNIFELSKRAALEHGLYDPYPVQYTRWLSTLVRGDWGYSPSLRDEVLPALLKRSAVTAEVTLFAVLAFIPLGLAAGAVAGGRRNRAGDHLFRALAFASTAVPSFILGMLLLAFFYVGLRWFPPDRLSTPMSMVVRSAEFQTYTGLLTVDGLLNGRLDVSADALRHLVLPVVTLGLAQWATLGRVTRIAVIDELQKDYIISARARGLGPGRVLWRHAFRNAATPALATSTLAMATLLTGVFIVEIIFNLHGVSEVITAWARDPFALQRIPDTSAVLGFAVFSMLVVQVLMLALDVAQALVNPRYREALAET